MRVSLFKRQVSGCALALGLVSTVGCGNVDNYGFDGNLSQAQVDIPVDAKVGRNEFSPAATGAPKVDLLFVVDNSGSMAEEQQILADSFAQFIAQFVQKGIDFQIGVISTDVSNNNNSTYWNSKLAGYQSPNMACLLTKSSERFLTNTSTSLESKFRDNVKVGVAGSGSEQGLNSVSLALDAARLGAGGCNQGFVRSDALLWAGVISDENEDIKNGETPSSRVSRVMNQLSALKGASSRGWRMDFIVDTQAAKPSTPITYPLPSTINPYPEVYHLAADAMKAGKLNIAQNFSSGLVNIGSNIIDQAQKEFKLSQIPIPGTLKVSVNGSQLVQGGANGFLYHADRNTIELRGTALTNAAGGNVVADYMYL